MKIYLNNSQTPLDVEILPSNTPTLDETLETFSFALISNNNPLPLAPMQRIKVDFLENNSDVAYFYIVSDSVETYSLNPLKYKHSISCIQNTRELSKHVVRNSTFTQPSTKYRKGECCLCECFQLTQVGYSIGGMVMATSSGYYAVGEKKPLVLSSREKVRNAYIEIDVQVAVRNIVGGVEERKWLTNTSTLAEINSQLARPLTQHSIYLFANSGSPVELTPSNVGLTDWEFNKPLKCDLIKTSIENDLKNLYISTNSGDPTIFLSGDNYLTTGDVPLFIVVQFRIIVETYYYSCYDILNLLIERQKQDNTINSSTPLFSLPVSGDLHDLLVDTIAPNFTFTQSTLYECVADVFRLFDAIFTMDENGVLGIEYFNDLEKTKINPKITGRTSSLGEDKYTNGLVAYYQDGRAEESFPSKDAFCGLRGVELGVPSSGSLDFVVGHPISSVIELKAKVKDLEVYANLDGSYREYSINGEYLLDMSDWIVTEDLWSELDVAVPEDKGTGHPRVLVQGNTLFFTPGDNRIVLSKVMNTIFGAQYYVLWNALACALAANFGIRKTAGTTIPDINYPEEDKWNQVLLQATYYAILDGRTKIETLTNKYEGETLVDQYNGAVDLNKMGLNMLGLSLKLGEPNLNATHKIVRWSDRIRTGQLYEYKDALWIANVVNYTFFNGFIQGKVSFVKNFNALALRTQLLREKRMSNISRELTLKSEDNYIDHVYISTKQVTTWEDLTGQRKIAIGFDSPSRLYLFKSIANTFLKTYDIDSIGIATMEREVSQQDFTASGYMDAGTITQVGGGYESEVTINVPNLSSYDEVNVTWDKPGSVTTSYTISGDNIILLATSLDERDFENTYYQIRCGEYEQLYIPLVKYGAGNMVCFEMGYTSPGSAGNRTTTKTGWFGSNRYYTNAVKYSIDDGFRDSFNIYLHENAAYQFDDKFPEISNQVVDVENAQIKLEDYYYYKQPNEIFALNYELAFIPHDPLNEFIGSEFINHNFLIENDTKKTNACYLHYSTSNNAKYSIFDKKGKSDHVVSISSLNVTDGRIDFNFSSINKATCWALCNSNGEILFSSNNGWTSAKTQISLYFYLSHGRLD